jgi:hypothetical protein
MKRQLSDWRSFWDIATPQQGATALIEMYGPAAAEAARKCATAALDDDRNEDYQFWTAVLTCLESSEQTSEHICIRK